MRVGTGYDVHRLVDGRKLIIGGVEIPHERGLLGHSDADVLLHAVSDALLGAAGMGDIGTHFPDTDPAYKGISSRKLLRAVVGKLSENGFSVNNLDSVIVAQAPRMAPHIPAMRENISFDLGIPGDRVNIKATTTEGLGPEGRAEGISAFAVCTVTEPTK
ncbi:MAG: 2-C-methyl-D-erythritol 2,4-cyclodiphosphate synthase [Nitrospirota bacterium]